MQWSKEAPPRYRVRDRSHWSEPLVGFAIPLVLIVACVGLRSLLPTPATYDCRVIGSCAQTLPMCGPDVHALADGLPVRYWGRQQPRNTPAILGFRPLLPTRINWRSSWDSTLLAPSSSPGSALVLREVYINWPPGVWQPQDPVPNMKLPPTPTPAPALPHANAVFVLDETLADLGPLTGVEGGASLEFAAQRDVALGAMTGTLYYLAPKGGMPIPPPLQPPAPPTPIPTLPFPYTTMAKSTPSLLAATEPSPVTVTPTPTMYTVAADSYFALVLLWHVGPVTLRLITVSFLPYWTVFLNVRMSDDPISAAIRLGPQGDALYPPRFGVPDLLQMATSVQPYTGCGSGRGKSDVLPSA